MADWFLETVDNPDRPLASLSLLLSEKKVGQYSHARALTGAKKVPRTTIDEVESAVRPTAAAILSDVRNAGRKHGQSRNDFIIGHHGVAKTGYYKHQAVMGRPQRIFDRDLSARVLECLARRGSSIRTMAGKIGVNPSTLSVSLKECAFSRDLAERLRIELDGDSVGPEDPSSDVENMLILLRKASNIINKAEQLARATLDARRTKA